MQGKQAKIVSPTQERAILGYVATTRYPARDRVMFLLSMKAGLRAKWCRGSPIVLIRTLNLGACHGTETCPTCPAGAGG